MNPQQQRRAFLAIHEQDIKTFEDEVYQEVTAMSIQAEVPTPVVAFDPMICGVEMRHTSEQHPFLAFGWRTLPVQEADRALIRRKSAQWISTLKFNHQFWYTQWIFNPVPHSPYGSLTALGLAAVSVAWALDDRKHASFFRRWQGTALSCGLIMTAHLSRRWYIESHTQDYLTTLPLTRAKK